MVLTASKLRENIYRVLDQVLETGVSVEVRRKGRTVRIVPAEAVPKLSRLPRRDYLRGDPETIVHLDWSSEWRP